MLDDAILNAIDTVSESCQNSDYTVEYAMMNYFNKFAMILESNSESLIDDYDYIQETSTTENTTTQTDTSNTKTQTDTSQSTTEQPKKVGFLQKIWNMIKQIFAFIGRLFKKFINWIGGLFKKKSKSADQIAQSVGIKPTTKTDGKTKTQTTTEHTIPMEEEKKNGTSVKVNKKVKLAMKNVSIQLNNDKSFNLINRYGSWAIHNNNKAPINSNPNPIGQARNPEWFCIFVSSIDPVSLKYDNWGAKLIKTYDEFLTAFESSNDSELSSIGKKVKELSFGTHEYKYDVPIKYSQLHEAQKLISGLSIRLEKVRLDKNKVNSTVSTILKTMYKQLNELQMSMNTVSSLINQVYDIDEAYVESADSVEMVSSFVKECINSGMPPRSIIQNIYLISKPEIRGTTISVKAGQSRAVVFPDNEPDSVYKFGTNGMGVSANRTEAKISSMAKGKFSDLSELIAPVKNSFSDFTCIEMERTMGSGLAPRINNARSVSMALDRFTDKNPDFPYEFADIHYGNIDKNIEGKYVAIDYGWVYNK